LNQYYPISSIWTGNDSGLIESLLCFYPRKNPEIIIDANYNHGRFWKNSERKVISIDIDPKFNPDHVCDNKDMPFPNDHADVVIYDPPHLTDHNTPGSSKVWVERFGLKGKGDNISGEFPLFTQEAYRILKQEGILLAKIADVTHNHRYQWQHIDFVLAAKRARVHAL